MPEYDSSSLAPAPLAACSRLGVTEEPAARVLHLEAGNAARTHAMTVPNAWPQNIGSAAEWGYVTTPQADAGPVGYPASRALGGTGGRTSARTRLSSPSRRRP